MAGVDLSPPKNENIKDENDEEDEKPLKLPPPLPFHIYEELPTILNLGSYKELSIWLGS